MVNAGSNINYEKADGSNTLAEEMVRQPFDIVEYWIALKPNLKALKKYNELKISLIERWLNRNDLNEPKHLEIFGKLLDLLWDKNAQMNSDGKVNMEYTLLGKAMKRDAQSHIKLMLDKGFDPNIKSKREEPIIFTFAEKGKNELIKLLIDHKVDLNATDKYGKTVLYTAVEENMPKIELVKMLIDAGANVNFVRAKNNNSILMEAIKNRKNAKAEIVDLLLLKGADPNLAKVGGKVH